jgi:hypothetical protein
MHNIYLSMIKKVLQNLYSSKEQIYMKMQSF